MIRRPRPNPWLSLAAMPLWLLAPVPVVVVIALPAMIMTVRGTLSNDATLSIIHLTYCLVLLVLLLRRRRLADWLHPSPMPAFEIAWRFHGVWWAASF